MHRHTSMRKHGHSLKTSTCVTELNRRCHICNIFFPCLPSHVCSSPHLRSASFSCIPVQAFSSNIEALQSNQPQSRFVQQQWLTYCTTPVRMVIHIVSYFLRSTVYLSYHESHKNIEKKLRCTTTLPQPILFSKTDTR